ncbi:MULTISPECIES: anti-sigma F factor antagonist [unclassified Romboutsia]|uniref:anti-sigma F factor antagonist n=1 Tax=unclassified Romboutsia TaxID=2626894 RepID=UPI000822CA86|nr:MULTISPECIES: anti-sigma F factor antagonist [unclassified Romboutsia]SCI01885.1 Stage II sporulation protein AA [uncultured Clostridium sp.]
MVKYSLNNKNLLVKFEMTELDHHIAGAIREEIDDILMTRSVKNIVFDFENINFMDSSGIGVIIGRYKKISSEKGTVSVINISPRVKKVFDLSGMNKIIKVCSTYEEALSSL